MPRAVYRKRFICKRCGNPFNKKAVRADYCDECRAITRRENRKASRDRVGRSDTLRGLAARQCEEPGDFVQRMDAYLREHAFDEPRQYCSPILAAARWA